MTTKQVHSLLALGAFISGVVFSAAATFAVTSAFYEDQLDRLAANPLCAAACNVLRAVRK